MALFEIFRVQCQLSSVDTDPNLRDAVHILRSQGISFWINEGSLLGLIREGQLIEWDHDIDISLFSPGPDLCALRLEFEKLGFDGQFAGLRRPGYPPLKFSRPGGRKIDLGTYALKTFAGRQYWSHEWFETDKFRPQVTSRRLGIIVLRIIHRALFSSQVGLIKRVGLSKLCVPIFLRAHSSLSSAWSLDGTVGYYIERSLLDDLVDFKYGDIVCPVPRKAEQVLEALYGEDWRVPKKSIRWTDYLSLPPVNQG